MAYTCAVCGKGAGTGHSVSHSNVKTKRRWQPNLQRVKILVEGTPRRVNVCTRCLRSGKVQRVI